MNTYNDILHAFEDAVRVTTDKKPFVAISNRQNRLNYAEKSDIVIVFDGNEPDEQNIDGAFSELVERVTIYFKFKRNELKTVNEFINNFDDYFRTYKDATFSHRTVRYEGMNIEETDGNINLAELEYNVY